MSVKKQKQKPLEKKSFRGKCLNLPLIFIFVFALAKEDTIMNPLHA